jgi:hypothetical protein
MDSSEMITNPTLTKFRRYTMKLGKSTVAATFAAVLIGGLSISSASAAVQQTGRVHTGSQPGFETNRESSYVNPRSAPEGSQPILKSNANGSTNGRQS